MANTKTARKAHRGSLRKRQFNLVLKNKIKTALKALRVSLTDANSDPKIALADAFSALDKAAKKRFIPKGRADRRKSRLSALLSSPTK